MNILFGSAGIVILVTVLGDVVKTTLSAKGSGFISGAVANTLWSGALAYHRRRTSHELLSFMGTFILVAVIGVWIFFVVGGLVVVFLRRPRLDRVGFGQPTHLNARDLLLCRLYPHHPGQR